MHLSENLIIPDDIQIKTKDQVAATLILKYTTSCGRNLPQARTLAEQHLSQPTEKSTKLIPKLAARLAKETLSEIVVDPNTSF